MNTGSESQSNDEPTLPPKATVNDDQTIAPGKTEEAPERSDNPILEDYELLEELGRGGMGVVYKARHKKLDRTVALKMILAGQLASAEDVRRFEIEAESAARLDHPGIVPIYEIGESGGNHFFAMKLIKGKSLADSLDEYRGDPAKSVRLLIEIARAVHHAHERGVLHRDLKPANILIDEEGRPAVTDLGLAKQIGDDSGLTQTGLVMGSPGFMSPEQASGKADVTTAVDIYSLGAVLYWLLAGRPPFQGETVLETILQTIEKEPESVRVFSSNVDRDLNLICQKALQKSSTDRYPSASTFADDLEAWLAGDALTVKPPSSFKLASIWVRKNFRTVSISAMSGAICGSLIGLIIFLVTIYGQLGRTARAREQLGDISNNWLLNYFSWVGEFPIGLIYSLPPFMVWVNVIGGIITIWLIKPKSREVSLVAATAAALLSGIIAFTLSLGWYPVGDYAIGQGSHDIELVSDAMWIENDQERDLAQQALMQRYPGLKDIESNERGYIVFQKILSDQRQGVPKGLWMGIGTTLFVAVLPLFFAIAFSGRIWDAGTRGWSYFGSSFELAIYSTLFLLIATKFVAKEVGSMPGLWLQLGAMAGLALAIYFGLANKKWPWRILGFLIAQVCVFSNFVGSSRVDNAPQNFSRAKEDHELRSAGYYLKLRINSRGELFDRFLLGVTSAYFNDEDEYGRQCQALVTGFKNAYRANVAERLAKICLLKPDQNQLTDKQMATVYQLADFVSGFETASDVEWLYFVKGLSEMRQGNTDSAKHWNEKCRNIVAQKEGSNLGILNATTHLVDAIGLKNSGDSELALEDYQTAKRLQDEATFRGAQPDWLIYQILEREYLETKKADAD